MLKIGDVLTCSSQQWISFSFRKSRGKGMLSTSSVEGCLFSIYAFTHLIKHQDVSYIL